VRVRLDKKATSISLLVALGVPQGGQKVLLAIKNVGGESEAAGGRSSTIRSNAA
jgi:putative transposase